MNKEEIEIIKHYILALLELQKVKIECKNLGFNKTKKDKIELDLIQMSKKYVSEEGKDG